MKTKLVYVLTCNPESTYIEQALISIYSARYWNQDSYIVLIVDNKTNELLVEKRGEILDYISEKIVIFFDDERSMHYRSRWLKTKVRELIEGDFLFIDCDTICCKSLSNIDFVEEHMVAVPESNLLISDFNKSMLDQVSKYAKIVGWNIDYEEIYYSSGVIFAKDTELVHRFYNIWHNKWIELLEQGINIDQPTFAYANIMCDHIIKLMPNSYNAILFTENSELRDAHILHISAYRNSSFLFNKKTLNFIRNNGLLRNEVITSRDWVIKNIKDPFFTYLPFDYEYYNASVKEKIKWTRKLISSHKGYGKYVDSMFNEIVLRSKINVIFIYLLRIKLYNIAFIVWNIWKYVHTKLNKRFIRNNYCKKF